MNVMESYQLISNGATPVDMLNAAKAEITAAYAARLLRSGDPEKVKSGADLVSREMGRLKMIDQFKSQINNG